MKSILIIAYFFLLVFMVSAQELSLSKESESLIWVTQMRSESTTVKLDSAVTESQTKSVFSYDSKGNCVSILDYSWDVLIHKWKQSKKTELSFDNKGNQTINASYIIDETGTQWIGQSKSETTFDENGNQILFIVESWSASANNWIPVYKNNSTFDAYGNITSNVFSLYDSNTFQWINSSTSTYNNTLGSGNKAIVSLITGPLQSDTKVEFMYDLNNNLISKTTYSKDNFIPASWIPYLKTDYEFNTAQKQTKEYQYTWDKTAGKWLESSKIDRSYDVNGNIVSNSGLLLDFRPAGYKYEYEYDLSVLSNTLSTFYTTQNGHVNKVISRSYYRWLNEGWSFERKENLYYSDITTGLLEENASLLSKKVVKIYNQSGIEISPEEAVNGLFIYQYSNGSTKKLFKTE